MNITIIIQDIYITLSLLYDIISWVFFLNVHYIHLKHKFYGYSETFGSSSDIILIMINDITLVIILMNYVDFISQVDKGQNYSNWQMKRNLLEAVWRHMVPHS